MKVCFIVGTLGRGGAEKQLTYMLDAIKSNGTKPRVLCLTQNEPYEDVIRSKGIDVTWVGSKKSRLLRLGSIIKNLSDNPADIVQSSHFFTNIYAGLAGKYLGIPSIGAVRSDLNSELKLHGLLGKYQLSLPKFLIVNSAVAHRRAVGLGVSPSNLELVQNVVETDFGEIDGSARSGSRIKILFVGRLDENKRPGVFIDLATEISRRFPEVALRFQMAGDGELRRALEQKVRASALAADQFEFLGECSDMTRVYDQADILVSTSVREGTSNVILEAMAHGLPVVATDAGGTSDIVDNTRGILVPVDGPEDLFAAVASLVSDKKLRDRLGSSGRQYVLAEHSTQQLSEQLAGIYNRLIED